MIFCARPPQPRAHDYENVNSGYGHSDHPVPARAPARPEAAYKGVSSCDISFRHHAGTLIIYMKLEHGCNKFGETIPISPFVSTNMTVLTLLILEERII